MASFLIIILYLNYRANFHDIAFTKKDIIRRSYVLGSQFGLYTAVYFYYNLFKEKKNNEINLLKENSQLQLQLAETYAKFMRAQINPHFFNNTLIICTKW